MDNKRQAILLALPASLLLIGFFWVKCFGSKNKFGNIAPFLIFCHCWFFVESWERDLTRRHGGSEKTQKG